MQPVNDAGLSNSPSARRFDATDEQLSAELKKWTGASPALHPVGELLDRHWEAAFAYARLCTDDERAAGMLTTAAFTRLFGETLRQNGPTAAWRPHLLVTVRRIAAEWDADGRRDLLHPTLRSEGDGDGVIADRAASLMLPPVNRRMLSRAFQRLPEAARCLLWHVEVEAEPVAVPAGLLGLEEDGARGELSRSRERLREECLQVHRELATDDECHRYHRLLDVTCRRGGGDLDPDLRTHLDGCRHCTHTADQLLQFEGLLGTALADGILGWAAAAYVEIRVAGRGESIDPAGEKTRGYAGEAFTDGSFAAASAEAGARPATRGRMRSGLASRIGARFGDLSSTATATVTGTATAPAGPGDGSAPGSATDADSRPGASRSAQKAARRAARRRNLAAAVLTVSGLVVLPLMVWAVIDSGEGSAPAANSGAAEPDAPGTDKATGEPSWTGADAAVQGTVRGRLHNVASGLCIGVEGTKPVSGAEAALAACTSAAGQQWAYDPSGLLRSAAAPDLCLDSRLGYSVRLAPCTGAAQPDARNVQYDFTLQGTLVPRSGQNLALAPAATDGSGALVLKNRVDSAAQRWVIDTSRPDPQMQFVNWGADSDPSDAPAPSPTPKAAKPAPTPTPSAAPTASAGASPGAGGGSCWYGNPCSGGRPGSSGGYGHGSGGYGYGGYGGNGGYGYGGYGYGGYGGYGAGR
ncbi:ricin-type beta-trefoil lectin domain protein [Streptomyces achromogenes]|uniref:ricin-type beta-trefoil lectin domain protein n=1 Tax=Streptomyces achromogenes TaxID=67255 RepID=UPI0027D85646|nr:ricin-type beta-trefoil lectin domain protein [Streptomyces achromogenes]